MVLLFLSFCEKTSGQYIECVLRIPVFTAILFFNSRLPFLSLMSLLFFFLVAICVALSFFFPPIALFHRSFSEPLQKSIYWPVCRLSARRLLPSINPLVPRFSQRPINVYICWLDFSSGDRFKALSMSPDAATTNEFYAEHSSLRHAMPEKFPINFTMLQKSVS